MGDRREWSISADATSASGLRSQVVAFAKESGTREPPLEDMRLAVSEAITNVVVHAYRTQQAGTVDVSVTVDPVGDRVIVRIRDHGVGMAPRPDSPGLGMGLPLMNELCDDLEITEPTTGGTEISMSFRRRSVE